MILTVGCRRTGSAISCTDETFDVWGCGGIRVLLLILSLWRQRPEKKIGLGRLPQTLKITRLFLIPSHPHSRLLMPSPRSNLRSSR